MRHDLAIVWLGLGLGAAALGCGGGGGEPDAGVPPDADTSLCAGRPCVNQIRTTADWDLVSVDYAGNRCDFATRGKYLMPATATASLQDVVFQDVGEHALHLDFMTQVLPEFFGGLTTTQYQQIIQRRATRQYWAGSVFQLVDEHGEVEGYGFDVITDPTNELEELDETELTLIAAQLATAFHLEPLIYAPTTDRAIYFARNLLEIDAHFMRACQWITCPNSSADCISVPQPLGLCGHFVEGSAIEEEYANKIQLTVAQTHVELPRAVGTYEIPALITGGTYTPAHLPVTAGATATYTVTQVGTYLARDYAQTLTAGGHTIALEMPVYLPETGGGLLMADPAPYPSLWGVVDGGPGRVQAWSCSPLQYQPWRLTGAIAGGAGGDGFAIDLRYEPPAAGSGPMFPIRAEVTLGGETRVVEDYDHLVYAGEHHNWNNQYWVLFDDPIDYQGHPVYGLWLDEQGYQFEIESAHTLDADRLPLDELTVTDYEFAYAPSP
jgi:hypothetical protein